jgi:hypothetical protein
MHRRAKARTEPLAFDLPFLNARTFVWGDGFLGNGPTSVGVGWCGGGPSSCATGGLSQLEEVVGRATASEPRAAVVFAWHFRVAQQLGSVSLGHEDNMKISFWALHGVNTLAICRVGRTLMSILLDSSWWCFSHISLRSSVLRWLS